MFDVFRSVLVELVADSTYQTKHGLSKSDAEQFSGILAKGMRWLICTGLSEAAEHFYPAGGAIIRAAQAVSAADALFIDRLLKGWRPNHFIDSVVGPFVAKDGS